MRQVVAAIAVVLDCSRNTVVVQCMVVGRGEEVIANSIVFLLGSLYSRAYVHQLHRQLVPQTVQLCSY